MIVIILFFNMIQIYTLSNAKSDSYSTLKNIIYYIVKILLKEYNLKIIRVYKLYQQFEFHFI